MSNININTCYICLKHGKKKLITGVCSCKSFIHVKCLIKLYKFNPRCTVCLVELATNTNTNTNISWTEQLYQGLSELYDGFAIWQYERYLHQHPVSRIHIDENPNWDIVSVRIRRIRYSTCDVVQEFFTDCSNKVLNIFNALL